MLVVSPDLPYPPAWGFGRRVYQLTRSLAAQHHVTMLCYARSEEQDFAEPLREFCSEVRLVPREPTLHLRKRLRQAVSVVTPEPYHSSGLRDPRMQSALDECLADGRFDAVQVESSQMSFLRYRTSAPLVLDEHNIESELLQRMRQGEQSGLRRQYNRLEAVKYRRLEDRAWGRATACVVTSPRDKAALLSRHPAQPTVVVPNGVDPEEFAPGPGPAEPDTMVFTGVLSYRPNLEAVESFIEHVLPRIREARPAARLTVVGSGAAADLERLTAPGVTVTGWVPDVRPHLAAAATVVVPINMGGGTRLKVLEALSMARPVVSTSLGCEGIDVEDGRHLLVADDAAGFSDAVCQLLSDPARGRRLGEAGRKLVTTRYTWTSAGKLLTDLHRELVTSRANSSGA